MSICDDNFETGTILTSENPAGKWPDKYEASGCSVTIESSIKHNGSYSAKCITVSNGYASCDKMFTSQDNLYLRGYFRISTMPPNNDNFICFDVVYMDSASYSASAVIKKVSGQLYWGMLIQENGNWTWLYESTPSNPSVDTWYCVETRRDVANDIAQLWVDGNQKVNQTVSMSQGTNGIFPGISVSSGFATTLYIDDVVLSGSYVGPISGASKLAFTAGSGQTVTAGSVSSVITVQVQDASGNPVTTGATVSLSTTSSGGNFYSDSAGTQQITSIVISSGQSSGNCYYKDTTTGTPTLTASSTGLTSATTQFTINSSSGNLTVTGNLTVDGTIYNKGHYDILDTNGTTWINALLVENTSPTTDFHIAPNFSTQSGGTSKVYFGYASNWGSYDWMNGVSTLMNLSSSAALTLISAITPNEDPVNPENPLYVINQMWHYTSGIWDPQGFPSSANIFNLRDSNRDLTADLFNMVIPSGTPATPYSPILTTHAGMIIQRDLSVGGFIASNQGACALGFGLNKRYMPPMIWLQFSGFSILDLKTTSNPDGIANGNGSNLPSPLRDGELYFYTGTGNQTFPTPNHLYEYSIDGGGNWVDMGSQNDFSGNYDTLHIFKSSSNYGTPYSQWVNDALGHLKCANITAHHIFPAYSPTLDNGNWTGGFGLGSTGQFWNYVDSAYYFAKYQSFLPLDEYDDLAIVKNYTTKKAGDKKVIDLDSIPQIKASPDTNDTIDLSKAQSLSLGCLKQAALKFDNIEGQLVALEKDNEAIKSRLEKLERSMD
jgi:hypothetical protein